MATLGQIITAETRSQRPRNFSKNETISRETSQKTKQQEMKENFSSPPRFISTENGMNSARILSRSSGLCVNPTSSKDAIFTKIENISKMPEMRKKTCLNILSHVHKMKETHERINKFVKHLKNNGLRYAMIGEGDDHDPSVKQLPRMFREYEDGVLTIKIFNKKAHQPIEIGFDKDNRLVSPKRTPLKFIYRYYCEDKGTFLCMKTSNDEYIAVELGQLNQQHPIFSAKDSKGVIYESFGTEVEIREDENCHAYHGSIQELQQKLKIQDKHPENNRHRNYAGTRSQRPVDFSKSETISRETSQKTKQQEMKENEFSPPILITTIVGMDIAEDPKRLRTWIYRNDEKISEIENISEMPEVRKKACLNILSSVHKLKKVQERVSKFVESLKVKDLEYSTIDENENHDPSVKQLPRMFQEDKDGVLTIKIFDKKAHQPIEIGFDKDNRLVSPKRTPLKFIYHYFCWKKDTFLCMKTSNDEYIAVELGQLNQQHPFISAKDSKGVIYESFGTAVRITEGKNIHLYRGTIQELQQKQK